MTSKTHARTFACAALAIGFSLGLAASARADDDRPPTPEEQSKIEAVLKQEGFTKWKKIEVEDDEIEVDDAVDANGKQFDLELDPKTFAIVKRKAE